MRPTNCFIAGTLVALCQFLAPASGRCQVGAPNPTLEVQGVDANRKFIVVIFSGGRPDKERAVDSHEWRVIGIPHDRSKVPLQIEVIPTFSRLPVGKPSPVQLHLYPVNNRPVPNDLDLIVVEFDPAGLALSAVWKPPRAATLPQQNGGTPLGPAVKQNPDRLVAASSKQSAAFYFSGLYSPAIHSAPQYSIDAVINPTFHLSTKNPCDPRLGINAQIKTNQRRTVDPDSYSVFPSYSRFVFGCGATSSVRLSGRSVLFSWNIFGPEFERKGKDLNLVTGPTLSNFFRLWPLPSTPTTTKEAFTAYLSPAIGLEIGTNTKNGLQPSGSGAIFRGVAGADVWARYLPPKSFPFKKVLLSTSYRVRIPAFSEISTNTVSVPGSTKANDVFSLSSAARNHVQSELDFMFTDAWGFTLKYEYGRIPPAFRLVDNTASVGLVVMFSQAGNGKQKAQQ